MTNTLYPKGAEKLLTGGAVNLSSDTIKVALVSTGYTYSAAHEFVSSLGTLIGTAQTLANKSIAGGVFDADDASFGALAPGNDIKALVVFKDTGNPATSPLLAYFDTAVGLPMSTNGGSVSFPWNNDVKKIMRFYLPFFPKGAEKVLSGAIGFLADSIKVALLPSSYTYDSTDEFLADLPTLIGTPQALASRSIANGVFDADDADFGNIAAGPTIGSAVIYKDTGSAATSPVLLHITGITGFPLAANGGGVLVQWSAGAAKIINLTAP